ncbi:MAG: endopeptidase La [Deltaproteobacteria bacterium]|nr:MAG: endopeptidase La [Deltaproteobacteria bacterium]
MSVITGEEGTRALPEPVRKIVEAVEVAVLPIRDVVLFPEMILPVKVDDEKSIRLIDDALVAKKKIGVQTIRPGVEEVEGPEHLFEVGTLANILKKIMMPDGGVSILLQGTARYRVERVVSRDPYLQVLARVHVEDVPEGKEVEARVALLRELFTRFVDLSGYLPQELKVMVVNIDNPAQLADFCVSGLRIPVEEKQKVLEEFSVIARLDLAISIFTRQIEVLEIGKGIEEKVRDQMEKTQREYFLREQLKAIQKELGMVDEQAQEVERLREKIEKSGMPETARKEAEEELKRLAIMHPSSAEYGVIRTYLQWMVELPWDKETEDNLDIERARRVLDEDHYGLEKVKERIIEFLAVRRLRSEAKSPILCFVGPPGVGKTSLGRSIARALGRKFIRVSLGGMRDEAEIRGHRRTYIGAMPGKIIQEIKRAGSKNPLFMLDEIDKVGADFRGDPASALLEVLDPEQNNAFVDHYIGVPFDLSRVMFITTANVLATIPPALRDRMEEIEIPGYTLEEKVEIVRRHLLPRILEDHGLGRRDVTITKRAIRKVIRDYTREAGLRNLERAIAAIVRKVAVRFASGERTPVKVDAPQVREYLGPEKFLDEVRERTARTGVATGLAWTPVGGEILFVEATKMPGRGRLVLTGSLGEVMKESAQIALSYLKSRAAEEGVDPALFEKSDIHVHVPSGAIPKDGPSAGVTIYTALFSLFTGYPVRPDVAMTGEITLRGYVLPVGGIKEKVLAAKLAGIKRVILPKRNEKDVEEIPAESKKGISFIYVSDMEQLIEQAIVRRKRHGKKK